MKITKVTPRGYCKGVVSAIELAKKARIDYPDQPITILGMLVHNQSVIDALKEINIETIDKPDTTRYDLLDEVKGGIVVYSAHGVSDRVKQKAISLGLTVIDATCHEVQKISDLVKYYLNLGYQIGYLGKKGHPESEAILELSEDVYLIETEQDLTRLTHSSLFFTNQTTLSLLELNSLYETIKHRFPDAIVQNEICDATTKRQMAILALSDIDVMIVIGDPKSHNTKKLAEIASSKIQTVHKVENLAQLKLLFIDPSTHVAITSGASTPTSITNEIIAYLEAL